MFIISEAALKLLKPLSSPTDYFFISFSVKAYSAEIVAGGCGLEQDFTKAYELFTEAAKMAAEAMRGRIANKLYEMAEQCAM